MGGGSVAYVGDQGGAEVEIGSGRTLRVFGSLILLWLVCNTMDFCVRQVTSAGKRRLARPMFPATIAPTRVLK